MTVSYLLKIEKLFKNTLKTCNMQVSTDVLLKEVMFLQNLILRQIFQKLGMCWNLFSTISAKRLYKLVKLSAKYQRPVWSVNGTLNTRLLLKASAADLTWTEISETLAWLVKSFEAI